ncbi:C40 family peptidase [Micropruina sp.]|uniref:C40 family peptidase n=1 Tax=Micropruina sp. TaxID=2737536 RepID=UPI002601BDA2|nr:C40 family peptidase [Micropruina sp.]
MSVRKSALSVGVTVAASLALVVGPAAPQAGADTTTPPTTSASATKPTSVNPNPPKKQTKAQKLKAKANKAIKAAKTKLKKGQYVWGAAGPNKFDCSGFMLWTFRKIDIKLPHSSRAQSKKGVKVAKKNLKPGDLVFFYSPVSHVAMYIGDGKIIHARNTRDDLQISNLKKYGHYHSARRVIR